MTAEAGKYAGLDRYEARQQVVDDLTSEGYLVKIEPYQHAVGHCYRCHSVIEPLISLQWFVKMEPLAKPAIEAVRRGETKFVPSASRVFIITGWKTCMIGVFLVSYGGAIVYLFGIAKIAMQSLLLSMLLAAVLSVLPIGWNKTRMYWTLGLVRHSGRFQLWAGRRKHLSWLISSD